MTNLQHAVRAALTFLQRDRSEAARIRFARDLTEAYPGDFQVPTNSLDDFTSHVQNLDIEDYMLLTRETLKLALWFKRALQAQH